MGRVKQALGKRHMNLGTGGRWLQAKEKWLRGEGGHLDAEVSPGESLRGTERLPGFPGVESYKSMEAASTSIDSGNVSRCVPSLHHTNLLAAKPTFCGVPSLDKWPQPLLSSPTPARIWILPLDPHISYAINDRVLLDSISKVSL